MTVSELIKQLEKMPQNSDVFLSIDFDRYEVEWVEKDTEKKVNVCATGR